MIVRMWHGRVPTSKAKAYREFTNARAIPDYQSVKGNLSAHILERTAGDITHFITLTFWESLEAIQGFAGEDVEKAKYYPEDKDFLLEFEPTVVHYEVVGQAFSSLRKAERGARTRLPSKEKGRKSKNRVVRKRRGS
jgi:heme-degrading monooxygenase HmoA